MSVEFFLDTNILVYALGEGYPGKKEIARSLLKEARNQGNGCISFQVVQEFVNAALKKFRPTLGHEELRILLSKSFFPICRGWPGNGFYAEALDAQQITRLHWYDCLILQAAVEAECKTLYSEDLQHGFQYRGVTVRNPFR